MNIDEDNMFADLPEFAFTRKLSINNSDDKKFATLLKALFECKSDEEFKIRRDLMTDGADTADWTDDVAIQEKTEDPEK